MSQFRIRTMVETNGRRGVDRSCYQLGIKVICHHNPSHIFFFGTISIKHSLNRVTSIVDFQVSKFST